MIKAWLNKEVEQEVTSNWELYLLWRATCHCYDSALDPLHNPQFVMRCQKEELERLKELKKRLRMLHKEYSEYIKG